MPKAVTMRTIAREAGVSVMTVSRVLRSDANVNPETARRVTEVADRMGYQRNVLVSTVMTRMRGTKKPICSHVIAYLTVHDENFTADMRHPSQLYFEGAKKRAIECGFDVEKFEIKGPDMDCAKISKILYSRGIQGLLVGPLCRQFGHLSMDWGRFASSAISINLVKPDLNRCGLDLIQATTLTLRNLRRLGYRRVGLALDPLYESLCHHRHRATYLDFNKDQRAENRVGLLEDWSPEGFAAWLCKEQPDVIIGHGTEVLARLNELGLRVPSDIGYAEIEINKVTTQPSAGVAFDLSLVGTVATDLVIKDLLASNTGLPRNPLHIYLQGEWRNGPSLEKQDGSRENRRSLLSVAGAKKNPRPTAKLGANFFPLAESAKSSDWQPLSLAKAATHRYSRHADINTWKDSWDDGMGLSLVPGRFSAFGAQFHLIDEEKSRGKGVVLLRNGSRLDLAIGDACEAVYLLMACGWLGQHETIANLHFLMAGGKKESAPIIAYYRHPAKGEDEKKWTAESGIQDSYPSFPIFSNRQSKPVKVPAVHENICAWRYLYCMEWRNPQPSIQVNSMAIEHASASGNTVLAVLAVSVLKHRSP